LYDKSERKVFMSRTCDICGKHTITVTRSAMRRTHSRRTWKPNLVKVKTGPGIHLQREDLHPLPQERLYHQESLSSLPQEGRPEENPPRGGFLLLFRPTPASLPPLSPAHPLPTVGLQERR
jgi:hypothetical protein